MHVFIAVQDLDLARSPWIQDPNAVQAPYVFVPSVQPAVQHAVYSKSVPLTSVVVVVQLIVLLVCIAVQLLDLARSPWMQDPNAVQAPYVLVPVDTLAAQQSLYSTSSPFSTVVVVVQSLVKLVLVAVQGIVLPICPVFKLHVPQAFGVP